jgi:hypothetical protein
MSVFELGQLKEAQSADWMAGMWGDMLEKSLVALWADNLVEVLVE